MNKRLKKKLMKRCGLKRYDSLDKLTLLGKMRLYDDALKRWVTANVLIMGGPTKNGRLYSKNTILEAISNLSRSPLPKFVGESYHPSYSIQQTPVMRIRGDN